jgi:aspartyl-tRNA synthetase
MAKDMLSEMDGLKRTHYCGEVAVSDVGSDIVLMGWVNRREGPRGTCIFIDLRDRTGLIQIVTDARSSPEARSR